MIKKRMKKSLTVGWAWLDTICLNGDMPRLFQATSQRHDD